MSEPREVQEWLRRLKWSLAAMPQPESDDIVAEARAHLDEAVTRGVAPIQALAGFGAPDDYARQFLDGMEISRALGSQTYGSMLGVVAHRVHRSAVAALAALVLLSLGTVALISLLMLAYKLGDPVHAGLWRNTHEFFIGKIDNPANATDLLGNWLYPLAILVAGLSWLMGRFVLLWALRVLARAR